MAESGNHPTLQAAVAAYRAARYRGPSLAEVERSMEKSGLLEHDDERARLWRLWAYVVALVDMKFSPGSAQFAAETRPIHIEADTVYLPYPSESVAELIGRSAARAQIAAVVSEVLGRAMDVRTCVVGGRRTFP